MSTPTNSRKKFRANFRLEEVIATRLRDEASARRIPQSEVVRLALTRQFKEWDRQAARRKKED